MFDFIWNVFIVIILLLISGVLFMFRHFFFPKKTSDVQINNPTRIEPELDDTLSNSVFNVRLIKSEASGTESFSVDSNVNIQNNTSDTAKVDKIVENTVLHKQKNESEDLYHTNSLDLKDVDIENTSILYDAVEPHVETLQVSEALEIADSSENLSDTNLPEASLQKAVLADSPKNEYSLWTVLIAKFKDLFGGNKSIYKQSAESSSEYIERPKAVERIALILVAPKNEPYAGHEIFSVIQNFELPLTLGKDGFLDQMTTTYFGDEVEFSLASLIHPGSFDVPNAMGMLTPGILFFMDIPTPDHHSNTLDKMLKVAARFGHELGGTLLNQNKEPLTAESLEKLRNHVETLDQDLWSKAELASN